jgi:hypothetical protein
MAVMSHITLGPGPLRITVAEHSNCPPDHEQDRAYSAFLRSHLVDSRFAPVRAAISVTNEYTFCAKLYPRSESVTILEVNCSENEDGICPWRVRCINKFNLLQFETLKTLRRDVEDAEIGRYVLQTIDSSCFLLRELYLCSEPSFVSFSNLDIVFRNNDKDESRLDILFPCLQLLHVREFRLLRDGDNSTKTNLKSGNFPAHGRLGALLYTLDYRHQRAAAVRTVVLENCLLGSTKTSLIRDALLRYVDKVDMI